MKDLTSLNEVQLVPVTSAASATVTGTGQDISQLQADGTAIVLLDSTAGGAGATLNVKLQSCATLGGTYVDLGVAFTQVGNAVSFQEIGVQLRASQKFIRALCTIAGTATFTFAVYLIAQPKYA